MALTTDGFNPFGNMNVSYSVWPVVLSIYNLPPWLSNKSEFYILSMIIPGPRSPGYDIDVYLRPLVDELKDLWDNGVDTYDAATDEMFCMKACLLWSISDLPALSMISGYITKGYTACPWCHKETCALYLKFSRKMCYMGHRRFLDDDHHWRRNKASFDGTVEIRNAPERLEGSALTESLAGVENKFGKTQKKCQPKGCVWKKDTILNELKYWPSNSLKYNLDPMHIQKNFCDNILGTILDMAGKTKDHLNARLDLQAMGLRKDLWPEQIGNNKKALLPKACFSLSTEEKKLFCEVLKGAKFPDGVASNISRSVNVEEQKISGLKSHDCHFILHYLLQVAATSTLPKQVASVLTRLGDFFRGLCKKVLTIEELDDLQEEIEDILCIMEKIFPPSFFDICVHLTVHLVEEVRLGGPVQSRWMFSKERYFGKLKSYVKNRARPEASIAEGYLAEESLLFCSRYLRSNTCSKVNPQPRNGEVNPTQDDTLFADNGRPLGVKKTNGGESFELDEQTWVMAHRYCLVNCDMIKHYRREHDDLIEASIVNRGKRARGDRTRNQVQDFTYWFQQRIADEDVSMEIRALARGPDLTAT